MKNRLPYILLYILGIVIGLTLTMVDARAQQTKTDAPAKEGAYDVTSSIEVGVRGVSVDGNGNKYRSDLNYEPGFQLFNSSLLM